MKKIDLIILPFHDYKKWLNEGFRTRDAHLYEHLKNNESINKVLVINRPVSILEILAKRKTWKTENEYREIYREKNWRIVKIDEKSYYLDILSKDIFKVLFNGKKWWNKIFNSNEVISIINRACDILNLEYRCLLLQNPMATGVIGKIQEKVFAFDAIDNWLYHPQNLRYKDLLRKNYNYIDEKADIIFTVSKDLALLFEKNININWISNGVDVNFFSKSISINEEHNKVNIGYVGKIQDRVDFGLIEKCLIEYKEYNFIFLGPILSCKEKVSYLKKKYNNIEFWGDIHYNDLPDKMINIDIAIIPHLVNKFTNSMNPLKLYEYLAAGKQVVTTSIAGCDNLSKYVYISNDEKEFIRNIKYAINVYDNDNLLSYKVINTLEEEFTWENKSKVIVEKIKMLGANK